MASNSAQNVQLNLKINGADAFNTLKDLNAHVSATKGKIIKMNIDDPSYAHVAKNLRDLTEKQKHGAMKFTTPKKRQKAFLMILNKGWVGLQELLV